MGLALLALIWIITFVSTYFFVAKTWWLPHGASTSAAWIDHQFALTYIVMGVIFVAAQVALGYVVWKYRDRKSRMGGGTLCPCGIGVDSCGSYRHAVRLVFSICGE